MNQELIDNLQALAVLYKSDRFRGAAYQKAVASIKAYPYPISDFSQVEGLPGIGAKIGAKIKQFLDTGTIKQVKEVKERQKAILEMDTEEGAIARLTKVWGIGKAKARQLYQSGITTVDQLRDNPELLTRQQLIGLKYYDDISQRIPREYAFVLYVVMMYLFNKAFGTDSYKLELGGSYRRGEKDLGDLDCVLHSEEFDLKVAIDVLTRNNFIVETITLKDTIFTGIAQCPVGNGRRVKIDIRFVKDMENWGAMMAYFSSGKGVNIALRTAANKLGLKLSEKGLYTITGIRIPVYSEKEIFDYLGVPYDQQ